MFAGMKEQSSITGVASILTFKKTMCNWAAIPHKGQSPASKPYHHKTSTVCLGTQPKQKYWALAWGVCQPRDDQSCVNCSDNKLRALGTLHAAAEVVIVAVQMATGHYYTAPVVGYFFMQEFSAQSTSLDFSYGEMYIYIYIYFTTYPLAI